MTTTVRPAAYDNMCTRFVEKARTAHCPSNNAYSKRQCVVPAYTDHYYCIACYYYYYVCPMMKKKNPTYTHTHSLNKGRCWCILRHIKRGKTNGIRITTRRCDICQEAQTLVRRLVRQKHQ